MSFLQKRLYPLLSRKTQQDQLGQNNNDNIFCLQSIDIIHYICKFLQLSDLNNLYATCRQMSKLLEFHKQNPQIYVNNRNPDWSFDLFLLTDILLKRGIQKIYNNI